MSWIRTSRIPASMALPRRLSRRGLSKMPGKMVRMSTRTAAGYRGPSGEEAVHLSDRDPPGLEVDHSHDVVDRGDQNLTVSGTGHPDVVGGVVEDLGDAAHLPSAFGDHLHPHHLVHPVGPLRRGRGQVGGHQKHLAPECLGLVPVGDLLELHQEAMGVRPGSFHGEPPAVLQAKDRAGLVARRHLAQVQDGDLTADPVGPGDPSDRQELLGGGHSTISTRVLTPSRDPEARTTDRMARAMRPRFPMTFPMSSGATRSWRIRDRSPSTSVTSTASGSSTRARAMYSRTSFTPCPLGPPVRSPGPPAESPGPPARRGL